MAANNNVFVRCLGDIHQAELPEVSFNAKECRIQCFPHVINTCVLRTVKALNNSIDTDIDDRAETEESKNDHDDEGSDDEQSDNKVSGGKKSDDKGSDNGGGGGGGDGNSGEGDVAISNVPGDPLNKIQALVRGIRALGQRQEHFTNVILSGNQYGWWKDGQGKVMMIKPKQLLRDVKTRWDSTYQMLVRVREFHQVSLPSSLISHYLTCQFSH
jgi:hypothetical protein